MNTQTEVNNRTVNKTIESTDSNHSKILNMKNTSAEAQNNGASHGGAGTTEELLRMLQSIDLEDFRNYLKGKKSKPVNAPKVAGDESEFSERKKHDRSGLRVGLDSNGFWKPIADKSISQEESVYCGAIYDGRAYWLPNREDNWIQANSETVKQDLEVDKGIPSKESLQRAMNAVVRDANVSYATQLAGYSKGIYDFDGTRVLVTGSPRIIELVKGEWKTINRLLNGMLGEKQAEHFFGWLKIGYTSLTTGNFVPGQIPVFAGPKDCGKSFVQDRIITPIFGGRSAKPYQYMTGLTQFNSDLFRAEHQIISDENPATDMQSRRAFGAAIKNLTVEPDQRLHSKGKDAIILRPFWRITIAVNDELEYLQTLPPLDASLMDKLMLFHVARPDCLPTDAEGEREKFASSIARELPAFVYYLVHEHQIRPELKGGRFGIKEYHNPTLLYLLEAISPEAAAMDLINTGIFGGGDGDGDGGGGGGGGGGRGAGSGLEYWEGTAGDLTAKLKARDSAVSSEAQKTIWNSQQMGKMLSKIENSTGEYKGVITSKISRGKRLFRI
jgi:hypothetical protein